MDELQGLGPVLCCLIRSISRGQCHGAVGCMQAEGGEDMLLDEFEGLGLHCEPRTQLVVLCEVCRRPSTKECWTCGMKICDFCTLKRHWKVQYTCHAEVCYSHPHSL